MPQPDVEHVQHTGMQPVQLVQQGAIDSFLPWQQLSQGFSLGLYLSTLNLSSLNATLRSRRKSTYGSSCGSSITKALPLRPMRAVLPTLCTNVEGS